MAAAIKDDRWKPQFSYIQYRTRISDLNHSKSWEHCFWLGQKEVTRKTSDLLHMLILITQIIHNVWHL